MNQTMTVCVAYARPDKQWEIPLNVTAETTIAIAIQRSGILSLCSELSMDQLEVGIFSRKAALDDLLEEGDRVEIYRPLEIDPKEARRRRVGAKS